MLSILTGAQAAQHGKVDGNSATSANFKVLQKGINIA